MRNDYKDVHNMVYTQKLFAQTEDQYKSLVIFQQAKLILYKRDSKFHVLWNEHIEMWKKRWIQQKQFDPLYPIKCLNINRNVMNMHMYLVFKIVTPAPSCPLIFYIQHCRSV